MKLDGFDLTPVIEYLAEQVSVKVVEHLRHSGLGAPAAVRPRLLTVDQAAVYLGRTKEAVQHMIGSGKIPTVRSDRRVFVDIRDLDGWIEENKLRQAA